MKKCVLKTDKSLSLSSEVFCNKNSKFEFAVIYFITIILILTFVVICFVEVDDTVKAMGVLTTDENISIVKNFVTGKVQKINYIPGSLVKKNDLLLQIDISDLELKLNNISLLYNKAYDELTSYKILLELIENENVYSIYNKNNLASIEYQSYKKTIDKLEKKIEISKNEYYDEVIKPAGFTTKNQIRDKKILYEYSKCELSEFKTRYKNDLTISINNYEKQLIEYRGSILSIENQIKNSKIYSPISGYVQEIKKFNEGDVLQSMEEIIKIVPSADKNFKAELYISAKDAGKVCKGADVKLRFPAYPFYEYKGVTSMIQLFDEDSKNTNNGLFYKISCDVTGTGLENKKGEKKYLRSGLEVDGRIVVERDTIYKLLLKKLKIDL